VRPLDDVDCAIVRQLQEHGDLPNVALARRVGLSPAATLRRVQQLRQDGVLTGVHAAVDHEQVGLRVEAFVLVTLREHTPEGDTRFSRELARLPSVLRADAVTGPTTSSSTSRGRTPANSRRCCARCPGSAPRA
jgi:Lrp/AsnC family leucine-responsive transcriptional regulator